MNTQMNELFQSFVELVEDGHVKLFLNDEGQLLAKRDGEWYLVKEELREYIETNYDISKIN